MNRRLLMGLDVGGSRVRCLIADVESGKTIATDRAYLHRVAPDSGGFGFDLDTDLVWRLLGEATRECLARAKASAKDVAAVATTSMRHGTVVIDRGGKVLLATPTRCARAASEGLGLAADRGHELHARTGHWPNPVFAAARLLWMKENARASFDKAHAFLSISGFVDYALTGRVAAEPSLASETLLFEVGTRKWADDLISSMDLPRHLFPEIGDSGRPIGAMSKRAAEHLGLVEGTPIALGGADTQCGLLGSGAIQPGQLAVVAGSTMPIQAVLDRPLVDAEARLWTSHHLIPGRWVLESIAGPTGDALEWIAGVLHGDRKDAAACLAAEALESSPGALGVLSTLGAEIFNASMLSLPLGHVTLSPMMSPDDPGRRRHVARAVLEGMAYGARANIDQTLRGAKIAATAIRLTGGMSKSACFAQVLADATGKRVEVSATPEASALGAAICAGVGAGVFPDLAEGAARLSKIGRMYEADPQRAKTYASLYEGWLSVRRAREEADALAQGMAVQALSSASNEKTASSAGVRAFRPKILVTASMDEASLAQLRTIGDVNYAGFRDELRLLCGDDLVEALSGVHVFITEVDALDAEVLEKATDLRVVASCRGNAVNVDFDACAAHGIPVITTPGRNADAVAELAVALMLMLGRRLAPATRFLHEPGGVAGDIGRMGRAYAALQGSELWGKTIGLVGLGAIGRKVAERVRPFGARVLTFDPFISDERAILAGAERTSLERLLEESDFVSLHAAVKEGAPPILDAEGLERMKPTAFLVNTARPQLVDESALIEALRRAKIAGAGIDVFSVEPPAPDHPLLQLSNVLATPHVGGNTIEVGAHQGAIVCAELERMIAGGLDFLAPRIKPSKAVLDRLKDASRVRMSDVVGGPSSEPKKAKNGGFLKGLKSVFGGKKGEEPQPTATTVETVHTHGEARARMDRVLRSFVDRLGEDEKIVAFSKGRQLTVRYELPDVDLAFFTRFADGTVEGGVGDPDQKPEVMLKMKAEILDKLFTGRINGTKAAMSGKLSFSGDTLKAMSMQRIQKDLNRLYSEARADQPDLDAILEADPSQAHPAPTGDVPEPITSSSPITVAQDERDEVVRVIAELYAEGLITSTGGNVSVRVAGSTGHAWITPNHAHKAKLEPHMLVKIDLEGNQVERSPYSPSSERMIHAAIYRRHPEAVAVIHSHPPKTTILALADLPFLPISTEAAFIGDLPRVPFIMPGTPELAEAVSAALASGPAAVLQNHGLIVAGSSLRHAADMTMIIEQTAEKLLAVHQLGKKPAVLPAELVEALKSLGEMIA
jgi:autoinducer 2 (AI-2) kinase